MTAFTGWVRSQDTIEAVISHAERGFLDESYQTDSVHVDSENNLWIEGDCIGRKEREIFISSYHATTFPRERGLAYIEIDKQYYPFFATVRDLIEHHAQKLREEQRCPSTE